MTQHPLDTEALPTIEAPIGYLLYSGGEMPAFYQSQVPGERTRHTGEREHHMVTVRDARASSENFTMDTHGFVFRQHATACPDLYDEAAVKAIYDAECSQLVKEATGASEVMVFDHTRRSSSQAIREARVARDPAGVAHTDYTDWSATKRVRDLLPPEEAERRLNGRFCIVNVWRPICPVVEEWPLGVCDGRSVSEENMIAVERRTKERVGQSCHATYNPGHRWFYFPKMRHDEVLIIKNYESLRDGATARFALHASFADPTSQENSAPRESIETRTFAFF